MKNLLICLTSSENAISDGFKDISRALSLKEDVCFVGTRFSLTKKEKNSLEINYSKSLSGLFDLVKGIFRIRKYAHLNDVGAVFVYSSLPINWIILFALGRKVDLFWWMHDPDTHSGERLVVTIPKALEDFFLYRNRALRKVLVASDFLKGRVLAKASLGSERVSVVPFPYLSDLVDNGQGVVPSSELPRIIFFGRIEPYKGLEWFFDALIGAASQLAGKFELLVVGRGKLPDNSILLEKAGYAVSFKNEYVSNVELAGYIASSDVAVFPYTDATGTQAVQTAGALGCRVLCTDVGSLPQCIVGDYSSVIRPYDKEALIVELLSLLTMDARRENIAGSYVDSYSPNAFACAVYQLMGGNE